MEVSGSLAVVQSRMICLLIDPRHSPASYHRAQGRRPRVVDDETSATSRHFLLMSFLISRRFSRTSFRCNIAGDVLMHITNWLYSPSCPQRHYRHCREGEVSILLLVTTVNVRCTQAVPTGIYHYPSSTPSSPASTELKHSNRSKITRRQRYDQRQ